MAHIEIEEIKQFNQNIQDARKIAIIINDVLLAYEAVENSSKHNEEVNLFAFNDLIKALSEDYFILTKEQFKEAAYRFGFKNNLNQIFLFLEDYNFIRKHSNGEYLVNGKCVCYDEIINEGHLEELPYLIEHYNLDCLSIPEVIEYYGNKTKKNHMFANKGVCDYFDYEYVEEFMISKGE